MSAVVNFFGYLGKDAKASDDGKYYRYDVAVKQQKKKGDDEPKTNWFTCWHYCSEALGRNLVKGTAVCISGELAAAIGEGKEEKAYLNLNVNVRTFTFAGSKTEKSSGDASDAFGAEDEIPF